ncbi:hypothetical protein UK23_14960, partial [Lentzea aerocolonigenes]
SDGDVTGTTPVFTLGQTTIDRTWDFGLIPATASVGDRVWSDVNGNGVQDAGEPGVQGVSVELFRQGPNGPEPVSTMLTDANGTYLFTGLGAGSYFVRFTPPAGMLISPQDQ